MAPGWVGQDSGDLTMTDRDMSINRQIMVTSFKLADGWPVAATTHVHKPPYAYWMAVRGASATSGRMLYQPPPGYCIALIYAVWEDEKVRSEKIFESEDLLGSLHEKRDK